MGDFGFRISYQGKDALTCEDTECIITSKYALLKGSLPASGSLTTSGGTGTITIAHGLGYTPTVQAFGYDNTGFFFQMYFQLPLYYFDGDYEISWVARADATNVYLDFVFQDFLGGTQQTILYKVFIYLDKADL